MKKIINLSLFFFLFSNLWAQCPERLTLDFRHKLDYFQHLENPPIWHTDIQQQGIRIRVDLRSVFEMLDRPVQHYSVIYEKSTNKYYMGYKGATRGLSTSIMLTPQKEINCIKASTYYAVIEFENQPVLITYDPCNPKGVLINM